jgi:hypothetical protein
MRFEIAEVGMPKSEEPKIVAISRQLSAKNSEDLM